MSKILKKEISGNRIEITFSDEKINFAVFSNKSQPLHVSQDLDKQLGEYGKILLKYSLDHMFNSKQ